MELFLKGHDYKYALEQIMLMLFPEEKPSYPAAPTGAPSARVSLGGGKTYARAECVLQMGGGTYRGSASVRRDALCDSLVTERLLQRIVKLSFYRAGVRYFGKRPVWGALSGIRPTTLMTRLLDEGLSDAGARGEFRRLYDVSPERTELCLKTAHAAQKVKQSLAPRDICLYLGIPFCPTRCAYCSFVSQSVEKSMAQIPAFLQALEQDMTATGEAVKQAGCRVVAVYFGGGTPTTLSPEQLDALCAHLERCFDLSQCREFTVEAGRPDTITAEKLRVLKNHGVSRVSVNPQTMSDHVLAAIGRKHTARDVTQALALVRAEGGFAVNMDLIAGLPEDTPGGFESTLEQVLRLAPENITVHTLALKKGSRITLEGTHIPTAAEAAQMVDSARYRLEEAGYMPYYLYRQKFMSGGLENVGWCRAGSENLYNICIMEELCGIVAMGAGASTKLTLGDGKLQRFFAPKYPREYIDGIEKVCRSKEIIPQFYGATGV